MTLVNGDDFFMKSLRNVKLFIFLLAFVYKVCWCFLTRDCWKMSRVIVFFLKNLYGPRFFFKIGTLELSKFGRNCHLWVFKLSIYYSNAKFSEKYRCLPQKSSFFHVNSQLNNKTKTNSVLSKIKFIKFSENKDVKKVLFSHFHGFCHSQSYKISLFWFPSMSS